MRCNAVFVLTINNRIIQLINTRSCDDEINLTVNVETVKQQHPVGTLERKMNVEQMSRNVK